MEEIVAILNFVVDFWYITLPASLFLMFGARYTTKVVFVVVGFLIGLSMVFPWFSSLEIFQPILRIEAGRYLALIVISLLTAVLVYVLYKYLIFVGAFFVTFVLLLFLERAVIQRFDLKPPHWEWLQYVLPVFIGVLAGYTAYYREEEFSKVLSVTTGTLAFSLLSLYGVAKLFGINLTIEQFLKNKFLLSIYLLTVLSLELLSLRVVFGEKRGLRSKDDGTKTVR